MKKSILLLAVLFLAGSTALLARGGGSARGGGRGKGENRHGRHMAELFEKPEQGELLVGLEGEVVFVELSGAPDGKSRLLKTADAVYLLPPSRDLKEGMKLKVDGYILQPKEGAELKGFDYEGKKIVPALMVTMASDEEGSTLHMGGKKKYDKRRGRKGKGGRKQKGHRDGHDNDWDDSSPGDAEPEGQADTEEEGDTEGQDEPS
ncbi:hypothetical protein P0082_08795 [Candidatus Haliotispira prima]|uniref:DUF5666 domain-containing protein n=1 Tax=Candidatus Haliotispira prima TaxID=3034016 RepID=A0ABY8MID8_9SPIO|nr:hypothetical protein P0082_08795 [Candidatus Haliotispira prima]